MGVEYVIELFSPDASFGPGTKVGELWGARNCGWSAYDRRPGKGFATVSQRDPLLPLLDPLLTHVKVWRITPTNSVNVFSGKYIDHDSSAEDVVLEFYDYLAELSVSRAGFKTMYPSKMIGTEVVSPEWALARGAAYSPLGFVTTGTVENPLGSDGSTVLTTSASFGLLDQMRLQLFYDLSEMGRANTANQVTFEITRTSPHTFNFWRNKGSVRDIGLALNGSVSGYRNLPNWKSYRNDIASVGLSSSGGPAEISKTDESAAAARSRRQDVFTIKTLIGVSGAATEADQQQAVLARTLKAAVQQQPAVMLTLMPGTIEPFTGWDLCDKLPVEVSNGIDSVTGYRRIAGVQALWTEAGEQLSIVTEAIAS